MRRRQGGYWRASDATLHRVGRAGTGDGGRRLGRGRCRRRSRRKPMPCWRGWAKLAEQIAAYRRQRQGACHAEAIDARFMAGEWRLLAEVPVKDRAEVLRARKLDNEGHA